MERRLIPAHAGKTSAASLSQSQPPGSSPLTRGKHLIKKKGTTIWRLIPAHAGKTHSVTKGPRSSAAHPRSRGENALRHEGTEIVGGSSPLTRGKPVHVPGVRGPRRLIPAHAGKTIHSTNRADSCGTHPRSRGENGEVGLEPGGSGGSSPLTRGKLLSRSVDERRERLIPAHAGKTVNTITSARAIEAHPRSRGENDNPALLVGKCGGSSPLTRGKPPRADPRRLPARLIPAHAGKTCRCPASRPSTWAHPRSRGENDRRSSRRA
ncbi:hypothetical protein HMPREF0970_01426 [Schaalia odontolytica F0309]|nr:hypothetical protein HMPREF0970_01426 [Schaalia odontolytica F0309]